MKNAIYVLIFVVIIFGCNEQKTHVLQETEVNKVQEKSLSIDFKFKTSEADEFKIMMNNIKVDEFQKKNIQIVENVIPSTTEDKIVAKFDPNNISKQVVISLGNKVEKEVTINSILISYGDKHFNLKSPEDFNANLLFNKFIVRDSSSNTLTTKRIDGKLNPTFRIKNSLINQLQSE